MSKKDYRVRNWPKYNKALIDRGSITLWIDEESINGWYENKNLSRKAGRPKKYSNVAIKTMLLLKQVYRLTLRSCHGFVKSLMKLLKLNLEIPSYTQVCRRQESIQLPHMAKSSESIHMVIDASGLKVFGEGEWKVRQHGWEKHRTWRKLHIGVDEKTRLIVSSALTDRKCGDDKKLPDLLNQYEGDIHQVSADGAYDSHECFDEITRRNAISTIPTQPNPRHKPKIKKDIKRPRDEVVWQIQQLGRAEWKKQSGYHRRSLVENAFYRYKQIFGEKLMAHKLENERTEALLRCYALNKMTLLGMPVSVPMSSNKECATA